MSGPGPLRWLWYSLGGRLPDEYREWVLRDLTGRGWAFRHILRSTVVVGPLAAVWWLLPAPLLLHLGMSALAVVVGYFYSCAYMVESAELRLVKHGFPPGTFQAMRDEQDRESKELAKQRYEAIYRRH